jgi:hypothetical protein
MNDTDRIKAEFREENRRQIIIGSGAMIMLVLGLFFTNGDAPIYGFFSFCVGVIVTRWAFKV